MAAARQPPRLRPRTLGNGVVVATGDDWRRKRALVQPLVLAVPAQRFHLDSGSTRAGIFPGLTLQPTGPVLATLRPAGTDRDDGGAR